LQEQRASIGVAVEVSIVSVLREVIARGVLEAHWSRGTASGSSLDTANPSMALNLSSTFLLEIRCFQQMNHLDIMTILLI
jgi:hypothetical protein